MLNLVLSHHENDAEFAEEFSTELGRHGYSVKLDKHPIEEALWGGGWSRRFPETDMVVLLLTRSFATYLNDEAARGNHNTVQNMVSQNDVQSTIVPLAVDNIDYPDFLVGIPALLVPGEKVAILADKFHDYALSLVSQIHRSFITRMRYISIVLLVMSVLFFSVLNLNYTFVLDYELIPESLFAMMLGGVAACSHLLFNITGVLNEKTFDIGKAEENYLRIVAGSTMGWLTYAILKHSEYAEYDDFMAICMVATFLAGFSSKLVVSVINQAISFVERALQLETQTREKGGKSSER